MDEENYNILLERISEIEQSLGIFGTVPIIILLIASYLYFKYLTRIVERVAEEASEKTLKSFQSNLDKEVLKFGNTHQKQVDAVHKTFQAFQKIKFLVGFMQEGENFTQHYSPQEEVSDLINLRHNFKKIYNQNRLLFSSQLCSRIDSLIPIIDEFIKTYKKGILERSEEEMEILNELNDGPYNYIAALWSTNAFEDINSQLQAISNDIENEFRKMYGTDF